MNIFIFFIVCSQFCKKVKRLLLCIRVKNVHLKYFFRHQHYFFYFPKDRHHNRIQQIEELLNVTRKNMKEESKKYFTALWLTGNSTKMDLQSISMVLNVTRGNIVRQLKEVQDNLTEQVHYLCDLHLRLDEPNFDLST